MRYGFVCRMRIVSWNVNGLYATLKDAAHRDASASAFFSEEAKIQEDKLEKWMACVDGYDSFWAFSREKKGYSGVVTYVKQQLAPVEAKADCLGYSKGYYSEDLQLEGRLMLTDHGSFVLLNVYVPNAGDRREDASRLDFKLRYLRALRDTCDELVASGRHVVVVGDLNLAHCNVDVHSKWKVEEIYSREERAWIDSFLTEYVDLFRHFHPDAKDVFSVWDQKTDARIHNEGARIDYAICDKGFLPEVLQADVVKMVPKKWSDHAAVTVTLREQPSLPPHPPPLISSRNMKRFQEDLKQKKLTSLFSKSAGLGLAFPPVPCPVEADCDPRPELEVVVGDPKPVAEHADPTDEKPEVGGAENKEQGMRSMHSEGGVKSRSAPLKNVASSKRKEAANFADGSKQKSLLAFFSSSAPRDDDVGSKKLKS